MVEIERANGHHPKGLTHLLDPMLMSAPRPDPDKLSFDLDEALSAVLLLKSRVPADAYTAPFLGTEREGNAVLIDSDGLLLTIGYLVTEATELTVTDAEGKATPAVVVAYDYDSGFGLIRALEPLGLKPIPLGSSARLRERGTAIIGAHGGQAHAISGLVISKREFAGYWEYLLDEAIFTSPPHPSWSGAALIAEDGGLVGIGSLFVEDAQPGTDRLPGNMFVPTDLFKPIQHNMVTKGRSGSGSRPYLGMFTTEAVGKMLVTGVAPGGPAEVAGIEPGDIVLSVTGQEVTGLADMYRKIWGLGDAGVEVQFNLMRDNNSIHIMVQSADRYSYLKLPQSH
jgi:S1-C subfamily serine protease